MNDQSQIPDVEATNQENPKSNIEQAREFLGTGDKKSASNLATIEVEGQLQIGEVQKAAAICKEFNLPQEISMKIFRKFLDEGAYEDAANLALDKKLPQEAITEEGTKLFVKNLEHRKIQSLAGIIKRFKLSKEIYKSKITSAFGNEINQGKLKQAIEIANTFKLPASVTGPVILPIIKSNIQTKNFDKAKLLYRHFSVPVDEFLSNLIESFTELLNRGSLKAAKGLKEDFELTSDQCKPIAKEVFENAVAKDSLEVAKSIAKVYSLDDTTVQSAVRSKYDEYKNDGKIARALIFGKDFDMDPKVLEEDAWDLFKEKLKQDDYSSAAGIVESFNIPSKRVNKIAKSYMTSLKEKGRSDLVREIKRELLTNKNGLFSRMFGE